MGLVGKPRGCLLQVVPILYCQTLVFLIAREKVTIETLINLRVHGCDRVRGERVKCERVRG